MATLKKGSKGIEVSNLQKNLKQFGYSIKTIDGIFGNETDAAVRKFQADSKLKPDGIVGPATQKAISDKLKGTAIKIPIPDNQAKNIIVNPPVSKPQEKIINPTPEELKPIKTNTEIKKEESKKTTDDFPKPEQKKETKKEESDGSGATKIIGGIAAAIGLGFAFSGSGGKSKGKKRKK